MTRWGCLLLLAVVAGTQAAHASSHAHSPSKDASASATASTTPLVPTVTILQSKPGSVPTVTIPQPTPKPTATPKARPRKIKTHQKRPTAPAARKVQYTWILAYLTSYCPGSAGWLASSGQTVFYGMLANNYYNFGTRVFLPVIGMTGVVEDRLGAFASWNHFDVWSAVCYSTPTGWFRVGVAG